VGQELREQQMTEVTLNCESLVEFQNCSNCLTKTSTLQVHHACIPDLELRNHARLAWKGDFSSYFTIHAWTCKRKDGLTENDPIQSEFVF